MRNTKKHKKQIRKSKKVKKSIKHKNYLGGSIFNISSKTTELLDILNTLLKKKCSNLEIRVGMMTEMVGEINAYSKKLKNSILICLYYNNNCMASIQLNSIEGGTMVELRSFTNEMYEGNKYNSLLRYILMVIGNTITFNGNPITKVISDAINPISYYLIMKNFDILPLIIDNDGNETDFGYFINKEYKQERKPGDIDIIIKKFYEKYPSSAAIIFEIPLTNEELNNKSFDKIKMLVGEIDADNIEKQIKCPK